MDGFLDFQADGAAQYQARSQAEAGDRRSPLHNIEDIHTIEMGGGQVLFREVRGSRFDVRSWRAKGTRFTVQGENHCM